MFDNEEGEEYGASSFGGFSDYFRRKKLKLQNLDAELRANSDNPPIFRGVVAHVNGYTQPSLNDLHTLIVSHGGGFLQYLDGKTTATHIIASSLTPKKRDEFRKYRVVKPAWVVESIKAGRILPWDSFRVIDEGATQKVLKFGEDGRIASQSRSHSSSYREQTESSWYTSQLARSGIELSETRASPRPSFEAVDDTSDGPRAGDEPNGNDNPVESLIVDTEEQTATRSKDFSVTKGAELEDAQMGAQQIKNPARNKGATTSEEYNAQLLSNPHMRNSSVVNPDFIQQYYRESRLHHLSTWKAELKAKLHETTLSKLSAPRTPTKKRAPGARRYILHVDFDSFFAAVSLRKHPELVDKPVAIAHGTGGGAEIASCNYPARAFGVKNGMWMQGALQMCPELKVLPYDFAAYEEASRKFYEAILEIDGVIQSVSIDEALVDITKVCLEAVASTGKGFSEGSMYREQAKADEIAQSLRDAVKESTGCDVSVGIGGNILQAKLALRKAKPAGQFQLKPDQVLDFIGDFTVQQLPGVAYSLGAKLEELGVKFVKDIRQLTKEKLTSTLGPKTGTKLYEYARGIDNAEVGDVAPRKSVSAEINWGIRFVTQTQAEEFVQSLCDELHKRLMENGMKGRQLTMRIMRRAADAPLEPPKHLGHGKCDTFNKSVVLGVSTNSSAVIGKEAISILRSFNFSPGDLRGIGVQMTKLEPLKHDPSGELQSSQRQLNFAAPSPRKREFTPDLDEIATPRKVESHISIQPTLTLNDNLQKPLNITGTQFILPSQASSQVLAELPGDIRSKFVSMNKQSRVDAFGSPPKRTSRTQSSVALPPQSQLDPETLGALPEDVRAEIMAYYQGSPQTPSRYASPDSAVARSKIKTTPTKYRASRGRGRPTSRSGANSTLTQSNFIVSRPGSSTSAQAPGEDHAAAPLRASEYPEGISEDFLAALPEDIRREVLEEHKRSRLQKRAGLNLPHTAARKPARNSQGPDRPSDQRRLHFPPPPPKPTFTSRKLSSLPELREALGEWYGSFRTEGPFDEDVDALAKYLRRVILEERDVAKAVAVAQWLAWLMQGVDNDDEDDGPHESDDSDDGQNRDTDSRISGQKPLVESWKGALQKIRDEVNEAVRERGLSPVDFG